MLLRPSHSNVPFIEAGVFVMRSSSPFWSRTFLAGSTHVCTTGGKADTGHGSCSVSPANICTSDTLSRTYGGTAETQ